MKFSYSTYTSANNEVLQSPVNYTELRSDTGVLYALEVVIDISGRLIDANTAALKVRADALKALQQVGNGDWTFETNDGQNIGASIAYADTLGGFRLGPLSFTQSRAGEWGTFLDYSLRISCIVSIGTMGGNPLIGLTASVEATNPFGGGTFVMVPIVGDFAQRHDTYISLPTIYNQRGTATWLRSSPTNVLATLPAPLVLGDMKHDQCRVHRGAARQFINGTGLIWPVDYSYILESSLPYADALWRP